MEGGAFQKCMIWLCKEGPSIRTAGEGQRWEARRNCSQSSQITPSSCGVIGGPLTTWPLELKWSNDMVQHFRHFWLIGKILFLVAGIIK